MAVFMANKTINLKILTPNRTVLDKDVEFVIFRTSEGDMGVLPGHEPYSAVMDYAMLTMRESGGHSDVMAVMGGFVTIHDNKVVILSNLADTPDKIEDAFENLMREHAKCKRSEQTSDLELLRAEKALRGALVKMDVSSYSITKGS